MEYSVIIATYNEEQNVEPLYREVKTVMDKITDDYEIIFVDDGSNDSTFSRLEKLNARDAKVRVLQFRKNFGQSAAWDAGINFASGNILITLDGDLQNDPADIPKLLKKLDEGYDAVSGWRWKRKDGFSKRLFSRFSKHMRRLIIDDKLHDSGCSLKAYKKECFEDFHLYGELHRYIAEMLALNGFRIGEVKVNHRPRTKGRTKYGLKRIYKGLLDLFLIWFWRKYSGRPLHLFGGLGLLTSFIGAICFCYVIFLKIFSDRDLSNNFLSVLSVFLVIVGVQFFVSGIMSDLLIKNHYRDKKIYKIGKILK